jgi:phospholipid/cholesterol/gamma-HCH transport system substrate-binding protein
MPPSKKTVGLSELRVGLFVLAGLGILTFLILNATGDFNPFKKKLHLKARFPNADGLRPGAEVRLAGVRVGQVDGVRLLDNQNPNESNKIEAAMTIDGTIDGQDAKQRIRKDSSAQLVTSTLLANDKVVNITPGSYAATPVEEGYLLPPASATDTSPLANIAGPDFSQRLNSLAKQVDEITKKANEGTGTLGKFVNDPALFNNLNATIQETQGIIQQIKSGQGTAGKLLYDDEVYRNLNNISSQLQDIAAQVRSGRGTAGKLLYDEQLYNRINQIADRADKSIGEINALIADVRAGRGTIGKLVANEEFYNDLRATLTDTRNTVNESRAAINDARAAINEARPTINRLNTTSARIDLLIADAQNGKGTIGKLITDETLYNNINQLSGEGVKMIYDFRQNPKKYLTVKLELF